MRSFYTFTLGFLGTGLLFMLISTYPHKSLSDVPEHGLILAELFTSQSCSSCPATDKVLQEISTQENIIALSCHVTYWNHLHWTDTLSKDFCTSRQRAYAQKITNSSRVYTPQLVVNDTYETIGSRKNHVAAILEKAKESALIPLQIEIINPQTLIITYPELLSAPYRTYVFGYKDKHVQLITSGENKGRTVTYTNAVQALLDMGPWDGTAGTKTADLSTLSTQNINGVIIIVQQARTGKIEAAGRLRF